MTCLSTFPLTAMRHVQVRTRWMQSRCKIGVTCSVPQAVDVAIVGGGVSGICAARIAAARGCSVLVIEARNRLGGRARTALGGLADLGAAWVWEADTAVWRIAADVGADLHPQFGTMVGTPGQRYRFEGGASRFVVQLASGLPAGSVAVGRAVAAVRREPASFVELTFADGAVVRAGAAILAMPPRLVLAMSHAPALPSAIAAAMIAQPTFYGGVAKAAISYEQAFWTEDAARGTLPTTEAAYELYDSGGAVRTADSTAGRHACLVAFVSMSAADLAGGDASAVREHLINLLTHRYGEIAKQPSGFDFISWAREPWTIHQDAVQAADDLPVPRAELHEVIDDVVFLAGTEASTDPRSIGKLDSAISVGEAAGAAAVESIGRRIGRS